MHYSPLRYPGGKNCVFPFISELFYENDFIGMEYAEPYSGGCGLALRLLFEGYVDHIYINDLDRSIYAFWKVILEHTNDFCKWIENVKVTPNSWRRYRNIQDNREHACFFDLAKSTFFLNRTNVSGIIKGGVIGGIQQKGKYKIDARFNKEDLVNRIRRISEIKDRITLSNLDGVKFINKIDKKKNDILIYLDPPYFYKGADLYMNFYLEKDHKKLSNKIKQLKNKWLVSYDNHEFIVDLYSMNKKIIHTLSQSTSNKVGDEIFIFSEQIEFSNSLKKLKLAYEIKGVRPL